MTQEEPVAAPRVPGNGSRVLLAIAWPAVLLLAAIMVTSVSLVAVAFVTAPKESVATPSANLQAPPSRRLPEPCG
jgi:hypothetical protein